eukprot:3602478-Rhodomonas_salina.3
MVVFRWPSHARQARKQEGRSSYGRWKRVGNRSSFYLMFWQPVGASSKVPDETRIIPVQNMLLLHRSAL